MPLYCPMTTCHFNVDGGQERRVCVKPSVTLEASGDGLVCTDYRQEDPGFGVQGTHRP